MTNQPFDFIINFIINLIIIFIEFNKDCKVSTHYFFFQGLKLDFNLSLNFDLFLARIIYQFIKIIIINY